MPMDKKGKKRNNPIGRPDIKNDMMMDVRGMGQVTQVVGARNSNIITNTTNEILLSNAGARTTRKNK